MKLEEALPHYRDGKTIVSCNGTKYNHKADISKKIFILTLIETDILGEWTILEEPPQPKRMAQAVCSCSSGLWIPDALFDSEEKARRSIGSSFHSWPACDGEGNPIWYLVPEVK